MPRKLLVIGVGSIGERHVRCFLATGRVEASIVETLDSRRADVAGRYGVPAFADLESALVKPPEMAVVATPAHLHIPMATRLARSGVHLLIEKPLSTSFEGIDELRLLVSERKLTAAVAYVLRCMPALAAMRAAIVEGRFGRPLEIVACCGQHFPTYRPAYRETYYADRATGGGAIQDALTHIVNAAEWIVGPIDRLVADAAHCALDGVSVEDTVHVLARHAQVLANYSLNQHQAPNETTLTVICERGTARWEAHRQTWSWMTEPGGAWHEEPFSVQERDAAFIAQANQFLDAVEGRAAPICSLDEGLQALRAMLAALASMERDAWQSIDSLSAFDKPEKSSRAPGGR
jgi:predicted dehydrogenase